MKISQNFNLLTNYVANVKMQKKKKLIKIAAEVQNQRPVCSLEHQAVTTKPSWSTM